MMNDENDEEQQSLIHAHELKINAQDEQIQQQAAKIEQQAALTKRLEEKLMKLVDKEALKNPPNAVLSSSSSSSSEVTRESNFAINNQVGKKQNWLYDLGTKNIKDKSWNLHVKHTDRNMRELRASMKDQEDKMKAMEAAYQEMDNFKKEIKSLVQSSSAKNGATSLIAEIESEEEVEIDSYNSRENDSFDMHPNPATAFSDAGTSRLRTYARGLAFSIFSNIGRSSRRRNNDPQETELTSEDDFFYLDEDTYSLMMISHPCSKEWLLGIVTFFLFQLCLEWMILNHISGQYFRSCLHSEYDEEEDTFACVPFNAPIRSSFGVTFAQGIALILVLATQSDILTSVNAITILKKNSEDVPWDKLIGEEGNRSDHLWNIRIFLPNLAKFTQCVIIVFVSFVIIVQSRDIIDLLKDFTSLLVVSQADNILFFLADTGYLGKHLAKRAKEVKTRHIRLKLDIDAPDTDSSRDADENIYINGIFIHPILCKTNFSLYTFCSTFSIKSVIFAGMCSGMIGAWAWFVRGQYSGDFFKLKYPKCDYFSSYIGDGICQNYYFINTEECGWEDGDCIEPYEFPPDEPIKVLVTQGCSVLEPFRIGNGFCNGKRPYFTEECNWDGGDCIAEGYPDCLVPYPEGIGDGICFDWPPYNTSACGFDGGDCIAASTNMTCSVPSPDFIGDEYCDDYFPYNTPECAFDGGDCPIPQEVEGLPGCIVSYPEKLGDGRCDGSLSAYNSTECNHDGGDCVVEGYPECNVEYAGYIGDGYCDNYDNYNTPECGYDGGDCPIPQEVEGLPGCVVSYPEKLGDGNCDGSLYTYNSPECNRDGGDCIVEGYPYCYVPYPSNIGDGYCDNYFNFNTPECGYDGGDCSP